MPMWLVVFLCGFFVGGATLAALEVLGAFLLLKRLSRKIQPQEVKPDSISFEAELDTGRSADYSYTKKGHIWVVESDKVAVELLGDKVLKESKRKRPEVIDVTPAKKFANLNGDSLILTDRDDSVISIPLTGCQVEAVSSGDLPSGKWTKKFPVRLENKTCAIYNASNTIYLFFESSWEKESWCSALRFASYDEKKRHDRFVKFHEDFRGYLSSLNAAYPYFMKPSTNFAPDWVDKGNVPEESSSKVRVFFKKLAKKTTRGLERLQPNQEIFAAAARASASSLISETSETPRQISSHTSSRNASTLSEMDSDEKSSGDDGTLSWNLLISRLFFDAKSNADIKSAVKTRLQRTFSNMRAPSYIGEIKCTDIDLGTLPPYIHSIRVYPMDMNDVWSWEVDLQYSGGLILNIETRLEVQNQDLQKEISEVNTDSSSVQEESSNLMDEFKALSRLDHSNDSMDADSHATDNEPEHGSTQAPSSVSKWKSILNSVAKQVSQVPISLSLRVSSLRGTLKILVKPPPSDRLWFGFTSVPDLDINLETAVGEHKISIVHIGTFLVARLKQSFRDNMVLPNCESIHIPWMQAEKDDWVPRKTAPFTHQNSSALDSSSSKSVQVKQRLSEGGVTSSADAPETIKSKVSGSNSNVSVSGSPSLKSTIVSSKSAQDLKSPLIGSEQVDEGRRTCGSDPSSANSSSQEKPLGKKAKMMGLSKKVGEKIEEKRRHIEEKSRNMMERMRHQ